MAYHGAPGKAGRAAAIEATTVTKATSQMLYHGAPGDTGCCGCENWGQILYFGGKRVFLSQGFQKLYIHV